MFKEFSFGFDTRVKTFSPLISRLINDGLLDSRPCCNQTLLQLINVPHWLLMNTFLHHSPQTPCLVVHIIGVRTIGRQQVWLDKIWGFVLQQLNGLTHTVCWRVVLLETGKCITIASNVTGGWQQLFGQQECKTLRQHAPFAFVPCSTKTKLVHPNLETATETIKLLLNVGRLRSNVALFGRNRCVHSGHPADATDANDENVNSFSLVKKMKSIVYEGYLRSSCQLWRLTHVVCHKVV